MLHLVSEMALLIILEAWNSSAASQWDWRVVDIQIEVVWGRRKIIPFQNNAFFMRNRSLWNYCLVLILILPFPFSPVKLFCFLLHRSVFPLWFITFFDYFTMSFFLIYLNNFYITCILNYFLVYLTFVPFSSYGICLFVNYCTLYCHIPVDTLHRFSETYNFNSQHIKRQFSYPVFHDIMIFPEDLILLPIVIFSYSLLRLWTQTQ